MKNLNSGKNLIKRGSKKSSKKGILNILVLLIFLIFIFIIFSNNVDANKYNETKKIVVSDGDTLWSIANKIASKNENISVYSVISDLKNLNEIENSMIYEGQVLFVYNY